MDRQILYTVNITGDEWQITAISAKEGIEARKEGRELENSLDAVNAHELIYRACALARSVFVGGEKVFSTGEQVLELLTEQEIFDLSADIALKNTMPDDDKNTETNKSEDAVYKTRADEVSSSTEKQKRLYSVQTTVQVGSSVRDRAGITDREYGRISTIGGSFDEQAYRDRVITLSRYLERDSRRYDG